MSPDRTTAAVSGGPAASPIDPADGSIWTATANAVVEKNGSLIENARFAERVLHLSTKLSVLSSVVEPDSNPTVLGDQGFGSTPMLFQPAGCPALLAVNSKDSYTYVWRRSKLASAPFFRMKLGQTGANNTFYAQPTWLPATRTLLVDGVELPDGGGANGAIGLHISPNCKFSVGWSLNIGGGVEPQSLATGQVAFVPATAVGKLYAVNTGSGVIVNAFDTGGPAYTAPMLAAGLVIVGSADGTVRAFGSKRPADSRRASLEASADGGDPTRVEAEPVHPAHVARVLDFEAAVHDDRQAAVLGDPRCLLVDHAELAPERAGVDLHRLPRDLPAPRQARGRRSRCRPARARRAETGSSPPRGSRPRWDSPGSPGNHAA